jgi:hypothetical protein
MLQPSAALSVPLRAEKLSNQGRHGLGMFLEQEVPALEQVDFRFRHVATISFGTRDSQCAFPAMSRSGALHCTGAFLSHWTSSTWFR